MTSRVGLAVMAAFAWAATAAAQGMPQLDFKSPLLTSQVVWGAIIFGVFYLLLARYGLPPVGAILTARAQAIGADLERARLAKQDADQAVAQLRAARAHTRAEAQAEIADATRRAKQAAGERAAELNAKLDARLAESEAAIGRARQSAMAALAGVAADTAQALVSRLAGAEAGEGSVREAVGRVLAERGLGKA